MPEMIPVGNTVTPPNANQSLGMLSDLYGIKQQQLALQTGQANLAGVQAQSEQEQQKNRELQALSRFSMSAVKDPSYLNDDGSLNVQKFQQGAMSVSPVYGAANIGQVTSNVKESIATRQAMQKLSEDQNSQISGMLKSLATNPGSTRSDLMDGVEQLRSNNKDPGFNRALDNMLFSFDLKDIPGSAAKTAAALGGLSMQTPGTMDLGGAVQPITTETMGPNIGAVTPAGGAIQKIAPPGVATGPGGNIVRYGPGGAGLPEAGSSGASGAAGGGKSQSTLPGLQQPAMDAPKPMWDSYTAQLNAATQAVTAARSAATNPQTGVNATRYRNEQILRLIPLSGHELGPNSDKINQLAARLPGIKSTSDAYQDIAHYVAQNAAAMSQTMGVPNTNLGAELGLDAAGNVQRSPGALREIILANNGLNNAFDLYNRGLQKIRPDQAPAYQQAFSQHVNIDALRWADAYRRKDQTEITALQQRLGPDGIAQAQSDLKALKALADTGNVPR